MEQHEIDARAREARSWYEGYVYRCDHYREKFDRHLTRAIRLAGLHDARVESRAKTVESLVQKAVKLDATGGFKYGDPRREITDLVGARITVPLSTDIHPVAKLVRETFEVEEELERGDEEGHLDSPGYRSLHFLVRLGSKDAADPELAPFADIVVEIQVRTILQHAWAMLQHDVMYKAERAPSPIVRRRLVALAGLLELADREFVQVRQSHAEVREAAPQEAGRPDEKLTAANLRYRAEMLLGEEDGTAHEWFVELKSVTESLGISTVGDLDLALGTWRERAGEVAEAARKRQPWLNIAVVMDLLIRLGTGERYFDARPPTLEQEYEQREIDAAREAFLEELANLRRDLEPA